MVYLALCHLTGHGCIALEFRKRSSSVLSSINFAPLLSLAFFVHK